MSRIRFLFRQDSADAWTSNNPTLAAGEIGVELDSAGGVSPKFKIGNGILAWNDSSFNYFINDSDQAGLAGGAGGGSGPAWIGDRGFANTHGENNTGNLDYFDITTTGNASTFGAYHHGTHKIGMSTTGGTRLLLAGGSYGTSATNEIEYFTTTTAGAGTDFGDLTGTSRYGCAASNGTYGLLCCGTKDGTGTADRSATIDYVTIATTANAQDFGDMTFARSNFGAGQDATYCLFAGGHGASLYNNVIDYVTAATPSNATDFGDLSSACAETNGCSNATKSLFCLGYTGSVVNTIDQVTTATAANSTDFGDLATSRYGLGACCNTTRAVFCGGPNSSFQTTNIMEYIDFASGGTAIDHGDLSLSQEYITASSGPAS